MKRTKYRIVEHKTINRYTGKYDNPYWTVEKRVNLLFISFWKTLFTDSDPWLDHSMFNTFEEAELALDIYTGKIETEKTKVVKEY